MITKLTEEVLERKRKGINFYTIPGRFNPDIKTEEKETLEQSIIRVFGADFKKPTRHKEVMNGRRFYYYVLERLTKNNQITAIRRKDSLLLFKYMLAQIGELTGQDHATVGHGAKTCHNLMQTDRRYREKCQSILSKIEKGLIILPKL